MIEIDPKQELRAARALVKHGDHAAALKKYQWFFRNAAKFDPRLHGVRISYAIYEWLELGNDYAPAMRALFQERDRLSRTLSWKKPACLNFQDVVSINRALERDADSVLQFRRLAARNPRFARKNLMVVLEELMAAREYELILSTAGEPETLLNQFLFQLNMAVKFGPILGEPFHLQMKKNSLKFFLSHVGYLFSIFVELGAGKKAKELCAHAIEGIESPEIRKRVAARLKIPGRKCEAASSAFLV